MPDSAKPRWEVLPQALSLPSAICPRIEPIKERVPRVMKMHEIETANEAMARSLAFCSNSSFGSTNPHFFETTVDARAL